MLVERFTDQAKTVVIRVMQTTCPLCHKAVQFTMQDSDFVAEQLVCLEKQNAKLMDKLHKKDEIIAALSRRVNGC